MNIWVIAAGKHGATREIGQAIADELIAAGLPAELHDAKDVGKIEGADAAIIGSAVYAGQWIDSASAVIENNAATLRSIPVWLFSSGPIAGHPSGDQLVPPAVPALMEVVEAKGHEVFGGKINIEELGFGERLIAKAMRVKDGEFRDWDAIRAWAREIAGELDRRNR